MGAFFIHERKDWHPDFEVVTYKPFRMRLQTYEFDIEGLLSGTQRENEVFEVTNINIVGEASGTFYEWILIPALKRSKGVLEAVLIWEGGDSIERLKVSDGIITSKKIDL